MNTQEPKIDPPTESELQQMWERIKIDVRKKKRKRTRIRIGVSACLVMLIGISGLIYYDTKIRDDIYMADSSDRTIVLADLSEVTLLKGAKLTVEKSFPFNTRDVYLQGDAIFKVTKSKEHPFIVHGNGYETKVLGTVFKVSQIGKTFTVDLYEGKVRVYKVDSPKDYLILEPRQSFRNFGSSKVATVSKTDKIPQAGSEEATLVFTDCLFGDAIKTIEETYQININYPDEIRDTKVTITQKNSTGQQFLEALSVQLNLRNKKINEQTFELEK
ncbi:hypothetical protein BBI01_06690 [Chryseobacterium artocarpi]|uniref:Uncharacterized protein n=1 Tax=Chryseobacterium artocarpi TaxID=1414727 RepID=A0A1B8ZXU2_9FLAO|nr:FecR family protein [Chryseobacterium artocarpi]OCA76374.1 hypothetical protein BBI01_06690 [Chryseobacterium artocarpi]